jgi:hypothetical protein
MHAARPLARPATGGCALTWHRHHHHEESKIHDAHEVLSYTPLLVNIVFFVTS